MLVYQHREQTVSPILLLHQLCIDAGATLRLAQPPVDALVDLLIRTGELEASVLDAACPQADDEVPVARPLRDMTACAARALLAARDAEFDAAACAVAALAASAAALDPAWLPHRARQRTSEGYALYAVYPETYAEAAFRFFDQAAPARVCAIGIRSIGTSLSAIVAAALCRRGAAARTVALRPRGEPADRVVCASERLTRAVVANAGEYFAVVDEGPGMSGSTAASVVAWLRRAGIPSSRIALFASHDADPAALSSAAARDVWAHTRTYVARFERPQEAVSVSAASGNSAGRPRSSLAIRIPRRADSPLALRCERPVGADGGADVEVSGGAWRPLLLRDRPFPAVHPRHERRKYLVGAGDACSESAPVAMVARFAGLGHYGRSTGARARALADAGFTPACRGCTRGFLQLEFVPGRIAAPSDLSAALLDTMAAYAAHLMRHAPVQEESSSVSLPQMLLHNASAGLARPEVGPLERAMGRLLAFDPVDAVAIDGRVLPHEWVVTGPGQFVKVDAFDHHRDDFFPGPADIAWDLAGAAVEWGLSRSAERYLVERYARLARDAGVHRRMPFFRLAYTAWRLGYTSLAADTLGASPDGRRFAALVPCYAARLRAEIAALSPSATRAS